MPGRLEQLRSALSAAKSADDLHHVCDDTLRTISDVLSGMIDGRVVAQDEADEMIAALLAVLEDALMVFGATAPSSALSPLRTWRPVLGPHIPYAHLEALVRGQTPAEAKPVAPSPALLEAFRAIEGFAAGAPDRVQRRAPLAPIEVERTLARIESDVPTALKAFYGLCDGLALMPEPDEEGADLPLVALLALTNIEDEPEDEDLPHRPVPIVAGHDDRISCHAGPDGAVIWVLEAWRDEPQGRRTASLPDFLREALTFAATPADRRAAADFVETFFGWTKR